MKILCVQAPRKEAEEAPGYIEGILRKYREQDFSMVVFPEKWVSSTFSENDRQLLEILGPFTEFSRSHHCSVVPGSYSIKRDGGLFNTAPFIHDGTIQGYQDKISLFRSENGKYAKGSEIRTFDAGNMVVSIAVCYDLDFPYFAKIAARKGASLLVNPSLISSEFRDMWHIYVKGRSLETRIPVVSINSLSEPFLGGSIVTRMRPGDGGIFLEQELLGERESTIVETNPEDMRGFIESRQSEDPGSYGLDGA